MNAKSRKPDDTNFKQQRLKAWQPILTPWWVIGTFFFVGIIFLPVGVTLKNESDRVVEASYQYDGSGAPPDCKLNALGEIKTCTFSITAPKKMELPVYVYYSLHNFYQNHRRYVKSRSDKQLRGETLASSELSDCDPLKTDDSGRLLSPCGLIANSLFDDVISLTSTSYSLDENGISWTSDIENKFKNPTSIDQTCKSNCTQAKCDAAVMAGTAAAEDYRNTCCTWLDTATTKYLWETYPNIVPKVPYDPNFQCQNEYYGVTNEHFIVWMRTAGLPTFRKLYGSIKPTDPAVTAIAEGTVLNFEVDASFVVDTFKGKKFLVISTTSWFGGKNAFLGIAYIVVGALCLILSALFLAKHKTSPRKLGDTRYLVWKDRKSVV